MMKDQQFIVGKHNKQLEKKVKQLEKHVIQIQLEVGTVFLQLVARNS